METKSGNPEFDSFLGGTQNLPRGLNLSEFIKCRMEEVVMLSEAIQESPFRGQAFQRLPKHMRRRQMSHYIKRLPRRLQRPYLLSLKDGLPAPTKRPSRKYRRKPSNLLIEYNRRQRQFVWLETHIWHAKRFHMTKKWGYSLAEKPVNKSFKACYRAISEHCLLIDQSYYNCIELEGPENELCVGLRRCTAPEGGLSFSASMYLNGKREGCTTLFHPDSYPYRVISKVRFLWRPAIEGHSKRKIWIWVHPLVYDEVLECFKSAFDLCAVNATEDDNSKGAVKELQKLRNEKPAAGNGDEDVIFLEDESLKQEEFLQSNSKNEVMIVVEDKNFELYKDQKNFEIPILNKTKDANETMMTMETSEAEEHLKEDKIPSSENKVIALAENSDLETPLQSKDNEKPNDGKDVIMEEGKSVKRKKLRFRRRKPIGKEVENIKLEPKNVPFVRTPKYKNQSVTMTSLKDTLNRFQLTGPLSHVIVSQAFNVASVKVDFSEVEVVEVERKRRRIDEKEEKKKKNWWEKYYEDSNQMKSWIDQKTFYGKMGQLSRPTDVPAGMVLGLVVEDPRLTIPSKRQKAESEIAGVVLQMSSESLEECLSQSPIWVPEVRDEVSFGKLLTEEINKARSRKIVPGRGVADMFPEEMKSRIPILLIQRPGIGDSRGGKIGLGSGWDIIAPAGFGMPIWLSLILRGARTGGLRESKLLDLECGSLSGWPPPDSAAGEYENRENFKDLRMQYFKLPPNKRPNFIKLGVLSPFYAPWKILVRDWIAVTEPEKHKSESFELQFSVLRDRKLLKALEEIVKICPKLCSSDINMSVLSSNCLIPIVIECCGKGKPSDLALLCLPEEKDLEDMSISPTEPSHNDENEQKRKILRKEHLTLLKSLKRKRRREKGRLKEMFANGEVKWKDISEMNAAPSEPSCKEYNAAMESLWLPDTDALDSIRQSCSRSVFGYVVRGEFSHCRARGVALGYVTAPGLVKVLEVCRRKRSKAVVLIRNCKEVQYRFGKLSIASDD